MVHKSDNYDSLVDWALGQKKLLKPNLDMERLLKDCRDLPFWTEDGSKNFNRLVGLPLKMDSKGNTLAHPMYDYEMEIFDALEAHKHTWIKKEQRYRSHNIPNTAILHGNVW